LKSIDLSWNGLGYEGILALCEALRTNITLQIINLSNNRINWKAAEILGKTLQRNKTLQALKVSYFNKIGLLVYSI
jgi:Ran GTPase-activating protein (RanGAP) involved in mRNA processing and transport